MLRHVALSVLLLCPAGAKSEPVPRESSTHDLSTKLGSFLELGTGTEPAVAVEPEMSFKSAGSRAQVYVETKASFEFGTAEQLHDALVNATAQAKFDLSSSSILTFEADYVFDRDFDQDFSPDFAAIDTEHVVSGNSTWKPLTTTCG